MTSIKFRSDMRVEMIDSYGSDVKVAQAARVSTLGLDNDREKFVGLIKALLSAKPAPHWSPFMHCGATFAIECPLSTRSQIVTHSSLARSEFSMRYSLAKPEFHVPADDRPVHQVGRSLDYRLVHHVGAKESAEYHLKASALDSWGRYQKMLKAGVAKEVARNCLPQSTYTTLWMTGSLRSWMSFDLVRNDDHAQHEVNEVARQVSQKLSEVFPVTWEAYRRSLVVGEAP